MGDRARIILLASEGWGVFETAEELGIWRKTAGHWRHRWLAAEAATSTEARFRARLSDLVTAGWIQVNGDIVMDLKSGCALS